MKTHNWLAFSILVYTLAWIALLALVAFVGELGGKTVSTPPAIGHWAPAAAINLSLLALFGLQHSLMARPAFKRWMARRVPDFANRVVFILASVAALGLVIHGWQPLDAVLWQVEWRLLKLALLGGFFLGVLMIVWATLEIDHFHFFGVKQCFQAAMAKSQIEPKFRASGLYGLVRHPIHLGMLLLLWSAPTMTAGHLLFAAGMTAYVLVGLRLEERDLMRSLGRVYSDYARRIPMLLPGSRRRRRLDEEDDGIFWGLEVPRISLPTGVARVALFLVVALTAAILLEPFHAETGQPSFTTPPVQDKILADRGNELR